MKETLSIKKIQLSIVAVAMAAIVALGMGAFAQPAMAENAVQPGSKITVKDKQGVKWTFQNKSGKTAGMTIVKVKAPAKVKTIKVPTAVKVTYKGKTMNTYKQFNIKAGAFKGVKAKTIILTSGVKWVKKGAFKGAKATKLVVQTKNLTKKTVKKGWLKGSKIKTVQVMKSKAKAYKKLLTKKYAGKKVTTKKVANKAYKNVVTKALKK